MRGLTSSRLVAVAFSVGADVAIWRLSLMPEEAGQLSRALSMLKDLGHVAAYAIESDRDCDRSTLIGDIQSRCGSSVVAACLKTDVYQEQVGPAFLMPVWAFDHRQNGDLASTAQLLGTDLEMTATPSANEEVGACLPGHPGRWFLHARPLF